MRTRYDDGRKVVVISGPIEIPTPKKEYEAVQALTGNKFGQFYKEFRVRVGIEIESVTYLDLSQLELELLDPSIGDLDWLEELNIGWNKLRSLPDSIGNLLLKKLFAAGNELESLPDTIGNLSSLETLDVGKNKLEGLPESMINLRSLKYLYVGRNPLSENPSKDTEKLLASLGKRGVYIYYA